MSVQIRVITERHCTISPGIGTRVEMIRPQIKSEIFSLLDLVIVCIEIKQQVSIIVVLTRSVPQEHLVQGLESV